MKEKKSNLKNENINIDDEQRESVIRLIGLAIIVYCIFAFIPSKLGVYASVPFTFFFGSAAPIILLFLLMYGLYMLFFKKLIHSISWVKWLLLILILIFALTLSSAIDETLTFSTCFKKYLNIYQGHLKFTESTSNQNIANLGGGIVGFMFFGLLQTLTSKNFTLSIVIASIVLFGAIFIFLAPTFRKIFLLFKKIHLKNKEKRSIKKQNKLKKKEEEERILTQKNILLEKENKKHNIDDLIETTEINIVGEDFSYHQKKDEKSSKLPNMIHVFDEEIYPNKNTNDEILTQNIEETQKVRLVDAFAEDFETSSTIKPTYQYKDNSTNETSHVEQNYLEDEQTIIISDMNDSPVDIEESNRVILQEIQEQVEEKEDESVNIIEDNDLTHSEDEEENFENMEEIDYNKINYELPPLYLLKEAVDDGANLKNEEIAKEKADILMEKMRELNVSASINAFVVGPSVTRFEIALAPGVRVGSFTNLQEDFKLALGVNSIRIESPIPGKSAIGIEVPNQYRSMVSMKEIITKMPNKKHKLYVPVGKDIGGQPLSFPICDMPHCLISGATNSGKSVCANTIILSILMNYKPSEVRMIMVDPKRVEMLFYKDIPHLLCPIITDSEKARVALDKLCDEMNKRFSTFATVSVKNIASYNELMVSKGQNKMPFILLVVDEFAELMLCKNHNIVEEKIQKLAQLGRAAGIHLILSTQRPDVNVIPGTIKTNLPCRMTFRLSSLVDSRTVIDVGGAEKLLNNGDMLLLTPDFTGLRRVQGVYVSDKEISDVVEFCKKQVGPHYEKEFLDLRSEEEKAEEEKLKYAFMGNTNNSNENVDLMYEDIKSFVIKEQKASTSYLQRKFGIGFNKAAKYIDKLEENGIIGPENGSKPREVLVKNEEDLENE